MNREKEDQLPMMQVGFIDSICLPIYEVSRIWCKLLVMRVLVCTKNLTNVSSFKLIKKNYF